MSYELTLRWYVGVGEHDYKVDTTKPQIVFPNTISALAYLAATHSEDFFEESVEHLVCGDIVWMNDNIGFALDSEDVTRVVSDDYTGKIPPGFDRSLGRPHQQGPIGDAVRQARGDEAVPQFAEILNKED